MALSKEEKERRKDEKRQEKYNESHKIMNGEDYKLCSICNEWLLCNIEYYYKNEKNGIDGYNPYCKECTKKKSAKWQNDNRVKVREYFNDYLKENPKWIIYNRELKKKRREEGYNKDYYHNNKEQFKSYRLNRDAHKSHDISDEEWENCKNYFNYRCAYCGLKIEEHYNVFYGEMRWSDFHKEHVDHKGSNDLSNCVPACKSCNSQKHDFDLEYWFKERSNTYSEERYIKILEWLNDGYKKYIKQ